MEGQHGQQQQQPPSVIIVQQPVFVGPGTFVRGSPFLRRGVRLNNGKNIGAKSIYFLGVFGGVAFFMGLIFSTTGLSAFIGILFMILGVGMMALCFKFCHKAKQDFDALPQDHPDRTTYSTPVFRPQRGGRVQNMSYTTEAYHLPPGMQIITSPNIQGGSQLLANYQLPHGAQFVDPSAVGQSGTSGYPENIHLSQHLAPFASASPNLHVPPVEDKPPSYDEVCKNDRT